MIFFVCPAASQSQKQHLVPPRYQPPPPPSGILKNIPPRSSGIPTLNHHSSHTADTNAAQHLNLKFPQEVPKLISVYIPEGERRSGNPSRIATARSTQQQRQSLGVQHQLQQPSPQNNHLSTDDEQTTSTRATVHSQQPPQQQEMLKFVRKSDTDSVAAHSPNPSTSSSSNTARMTAAEQNRHFQVQIFERNEFANRKN